MSLTGFEIAALGLIAAGTATSVASTIQQGEDANRLARAQARSLEQQAELERAQTELELGQQRRAASRALGQRRAAAASSGIGISGSILDLLADVAFEEELGLALTASAGERRAFELASESDIARFTGQAARRAATGTAFSGGLTTSGATLLAFA